VGASLHVPKRVAGEFQRAAAQAAGDPVAFAITGLNLLTGTNSSYAATIFISSSPGASAPAAGERSLRWRRASTSWLAASRKQRAGAGIRTPVPGIARPAASNLSSRTVAEAISRNSPASSRISLARANKQTELTLRLHAIQRANAQIEYVLDRERAKTLGVSISGIFGTLQTFFGGNYINDFNLFVSHVQGHGAGEAAARASPESVDGLYVAQRPGDHGAAFDPGVRSGMIQGPE